jgi:hypothetical protein
MAARRGVQNGLQFGADRQRQLRAGLFLPHHKLVVTNMLSAHATYVTRALYRV